MRLIKCIWHLGFDRGLRYWRIIRHCERYPYMADIFAESLESEALSHEANGVYDMAPYMREFAKEIRRRKHGAT